MSDFIQLRFDISQFKRFMADFRASGGDPIGYRNRFSNLVQAASQGNTGGSGGGDGSITITGGSGSPDDPDTLEARISNRQKHAIVAEYGSGIYGEAPGSTKAPIVPKNAQALIIPVSTVYTDKLSASVLSEAQENAQRYPDILSRIKGKMPGIIGFIFRNSIKGMRPIRMVRDSLPKAEQVLEQELISAFQTGGGSRTSLAAAVNKAAAVWLAEIAKRSPILTSNLKTGWTLSKLAK